MSSASPTQKPGENPLDRAGSDTQSREATPKSPETTSSTPREAGQPKDADPQAGTPKSPRASTAPPHQMPGARPTPSATEVAEASANPAERWGDLPQHARDVFQSAGGADMPARYRDWIDAYYRRLNKKP